MLKIWGRKNSVNVQKVLWTADEFGLAYERIDAGREFGVVDSPQYRRMNPNGVVPTIDDDGFVLWESNAIVRYLWLKHGPPMTPRAFAESDRWMDWFATTFWAAIRPVFWGLTRTPPAERNMDEIEAARKKTAALLATVDEALIGRPYLAGDDFGMGDIPMGCAVWRWFGLDIERPRYANLEAWFARLSERPAYRRNVLQPLT